MNKSTSQSATKDKPLFALLKKAPEGTESFFLDVGAGISMQMPHPQNLASVLGFALTIFDDAKAALQTLNISPHPDLRLICLSTIKKLIAKSLTTPLNIPAFTSSDEALNWVTSAVPEAVDRIKKIGMEELALLECQVILPTMAMENRGVPFNKAKWQKKLSHITNEAQRLKSALLAMLPADRGFLLFAPETIDLNNATSVKRSLEQLLQKKLSGTSQSSLKDIDHEAVKFLLLYREHARMLSTYGEQFLEKIDDNRLRGHFTPIGSASGRFACYDTNLLALPNSADFQSCVESQSPFTLMHFDYGAFELRILAALSDDHALIKIFNDDQDIHSMVAQEIFETKVSKQENCHLRDQAKVLNFGLIYGMGEASLAKKLNINLMQAKTLLRNYFKRFSKVGEFLSSLEEKAKTDGFVTTATGRRAYLTNLGEDRGYISRVARNIPIQGTGADIVKLAMCRVFKRLTDCRLDAHLINVIHDEIVIECHEQTRKEVANIVVEEMSIAFATICPTVKTAVSLS